MHPPLLPALVASLALLASPAQAEPAETQPVRQNELSLGATTFTFMSYNRPTVGFSAIEGAYYRRVAGVGPWSALRLGGGLRTGMPAKATYFPLEGFVQVQLSARLGIWEALVGPELGVSGFTKLTTEASLPAKELQALEDRQFGPAYVAFTMAPVRLHFGRVVVSAMELYLGTNLGVMGGTARTQLGLLRLGVEL